MADHSTIRVGVIGAGFIGPAHIESLRRLGGVAVLALAGRDQESAERKAAALGIPRAYGDYLKLIADPDLDVVHICSPNRDHFPAAKAALAAGKHVMCEKPLGMTSVESKELVALAEASGLAHAVTFNQRFYPLIQQARTMIQRGDLGDIFLVHGGFWQDWLLFDTDYNWRVEGAAGGALRAVGDLGSHWIDLAQFLTGLPVHKVLADLMTFLPVRQKPEQAIEAFSTRDVPRTPVSMDTEDAATVLLGLGERVRGLMQVSQVSAGRKCKLEIEVNGSRGSLAWNAERPNELWIGHRDAPNQLLLKDPSLMDPPAATIARYPGGHDEGFADSHTAINRALYTFIRSGGYGAGQQPTYPTFVDGHRENLIADAVLASARDERWVSVDVPPLR
ncbi:MAG TPA: Gfo/Idh/MocA family oxidoreductase [Chloroflexota bacterium]|nr:Gfo/Idh/MocA family oxidoreductase [Chloroflexota bacterium]